MLEWLDQVERSVLALSPRRVLEIGCGVGMVLYRVAPHVEHYTAVDISPHALETIRNELTPDERARVTLMQKPAHALEDMAPRSYDTVVINSVAQYFPDGAYLAGVLKRAGELVADGGHVFIGDVRSRDHLDAFHTLTTLNQAPGHIDAVELARRIDKRVQQEGELVLSEAFFHALAREMPRVTHVGIALKPGKADNEMNAFRYDVTLHIGAAPPKAVELPAASRLATLDAIRSALSAAPPILVLQDLPNARLAPVYAARTSMADRPGLTADEIRKAMDGFERSGIDPGALLNLHPDYTADLVWARSGDPTRFDAVLRHKLTGPKDPLGALAPRHDHPPSHYANAPAAASVDHHVLFDDLRAHLRDFLPEYMIPSIFVAMDAFPLTPNGKIDRKLLPAPVRAPARQQVDHVAPSTPLEESIASVWRSLLNVERVGLRDNIFDLGANSLLTAQANQRLSSLLNRKVSLVSMFRYPTIESLAAHLNEDKSVVAGDAKAVQVQADRKKDAAARRRELRGALES
jgi:SAM-dependent methyltransferase